MRALAILAAFTLSSCSSVLEQIPPNRTSARLDTDSTTIALWHFDESHGELTADSGPRHLDGWALPGATIASGAAGMARTFEGDPESCVLVPWKPELEDMRSFTIEAWIRPAVVSTGSIQTIAAQWTSDPRHSSWYFGVVGSTSVTKREVVRGVRITDASPFSLVFAYVSQRPGGLEGKVTVLVSEKGVLPGVWSHVAATFDAGRVRLYRDHLPDLNSYDDAQLRRAESRRTFEFFRTTDTQLTIGGFFDSRVPPGVTTFVMSRGVAFSGEIDEVRISRGVRSDLVPAIVGRNQR